MTQQPPTHPGAVLKEEFVEPLGLSVEELATSISIPPTRIKEILIGRRAISADTAMRLADRLGTTAEYWITLQTNYDLSLVSQASQRRGPRLPKLPRRRR
jgi:addiction module HigA family antidote